MNGQEGAAPGLRGQPAVPGLSCRLRIPPFISLLYDNFSWSIILLECFNINLSKSDFVYLYNIPFSRIS